MPSNCIPRPQKQEMETFLKGSLAAKVMSAAMRNQNAVHSSSSPALFKPVSPSQKEAINPGAGRRTPCEWCLIL